MDLDMFFNDQDAFLMTQNKTLIIILNNDTEQRVIAHRDILKYLLKIQKFN